MIKQITCKEIKDYVKNNPKTVLLDVRTKGEWDTVGKPDGDKIGLKTYFLEIRRDSFFDFVKEFKDIVFLSYEQSKNKDIAQILGIEFWTTIVVYKGSDEVARIVGQTDKEVIYSAIQKGI